MMKGPTDILTVLVAGLTLCLPVSAWVWEFFFVNETKTWPEARKYCREKFQDLSTIKHRPDNNVVQKLIGGRPSWIGLHKIPSCPGDGMEDPWEWSNRHGHKYRNWSSEQPGYLASACVVMRANGKWSQESCCEQRPFSCHGWYPNIKLADEQMSWDKAWHYCKSQDSSLVSLNTHAKMHLVDYKAKLAGLDRFWTSLRFTSAEWLWTTERNPFEYTFKNSTLPSCPEQGCSCGVRNRSANRWENLDCNQNLSFFCSKP